jgi:hypothetical protein
VSSPSNTIKKFFLLLSSVLIVASCRAETSPAIGLWMKIPLGAAADKVTARPSYIFTHEALKDAKTFTAFQDDSSGLNVLCCIEVSNLTLVTLKTILERYKGDSDAVKQFNSVHGLPFIYEARPVAPKLQNDFMRTVSSYDNDPKNFGWYTAPVLAISLGAKSRSPHAFKVNADSYKVKANFHAPKSRVIYEVTVNGHIVQFSENVLPAE